MAPPVLAVAGIVAGDQARCDPQVTLGGGRAVADQPEYLASARDVAPDVAIVVLEAIIIPRVMGAPRTFVFGIVLLLERCSLALAVSPLRTYTLSYY